MGLPSLGAQFCGTCRVAPRVSRGLESQVATAVAWEVWGGGGYHGLACEVGRPQEGLFAAGNTPHTAPG